MGRDHLRFGAWFLALITCLFVAGNHSAYAWEHDGKPHVTAGGWYTTFNGAAPDASAKVSFSVTGRCQDDTAVCSSTSKKALGNYEYFNHFTGLKAHGKVTSLSFGTTSPECSAAAGPEFDNNGNAGTLDGRPSAVIQGQGDDGSTFKMEVVDADDTQPKFPDTVCLVNVTGRTKMLIPQADQDGAQPLVHGNIEVKGAPNTPNQ